jgi:hypothetical protein
MPSQCHLVFPKLWGGPPGPRGSPWTRSFANEIRLVQYRQADEGVGCGPGGPPHKN